jgi:preprotein translocase subunit Sss1
MAGEARRPLGQRLLWFALLWVAGLLVVGAAAMIIRLFLGL